MDVDQKPNHAHHLKIGDLFWGLLLILIGGLVIASNLGYVELHWNSVWGLWPLIIIAVGASILAVKHVVWRIFSVILVIAALMLVAWVLVGGMTIGVDQVRRSEFGIVKQLNTIDKATVKVIGGAGVLNISSSEQSEIVKSVLDSNISKAVYGEIVDGDTQAVTLTMDTVNNNWFKIGSVKNDWSIKLNQSIPLTLDVNAGAVSSNIDLSNTHATSTVINLGASSLVLKLGSLEKNISVDLKSGVSSITIKVPKSSGVAMNIESGLTSNDVADLLKVSDGLYESADYNKSTNKINITAKTGVSSLKIVRY